MEKRTLIRLADQVPTLIELGNMAVAEYHKQAREVTLPVTARNKDVLLALRDVLEEKSEAVRRAAQTPAGDKEADTWLDFSRKVGVAAQWEIIQGQEPVSVRVVLPSFLLVKQGVPAPAQKSVIGVVRQLLGQLTA